MYNSGRRGKRAPDGYGVISVNDKFNQTSYPIPIIDSWSITDGSYNPSDDTALDIAGGQTVVLYGSGFAAGATVNINGSNIGVVTVLDSNRITFTSPALPSASYTIYVSNTDGATAIYVPGLVYSGLPTWSSPASGSIGTTYETKNASTLSYTEFNATGDGTITYSVVSGNLPSGVTLSSSGELSGTLPATASPTTYSFTIRASDAESQDSDRAFSLTINPDAVTWVAPSLNGSYSVYETQAFSTPLSATSAAGYGVMYSANTLPTGITLTPDTGDLVGYANTVGVTNAQLTATANTTGRYTTSNVTFTVNEDVVTWSTPDNNTEYTLSQNVLMSNVSLSATSAAGYGIQYTANALPTGVTLSGDTISGTPTETETIYTQLTATANTTNRYAYRYISWTVSIAGDIYWKNTSLLLNGATSSNTFINDASLNNNQLTIAGDTRPSNFNPYQEVYYSNYFDGNVDGSSTNNSYLTVPNSSNFAFGTGNFTIEFWMNSPIVSGTSNGNLVGYSGAGSGHWNFMMYLGNVYWQTGQGVANLFNVSVVPYANKWTHFAIVRSSGTTKLYINGVQQASGADSTNYTVPTATLMYIGYNSELGYLRGHISNLRIVKGTAVYTSTFTPSTAPLTAVANTVLLTCQSNRFIDTSLNNLTVTNNGKPTVSSAHPFASPTTVAYNTQYSTYFDGTTDYLVNTTMPALGSGDFTVECWTFTKSNVSGATVFSVGDSASSPYANIVLLNSGGSGWQLYVAGASMIVNWNDIYFSSYPALNVWQHHAVVRSGSTLSWYINGVQVKTTSSGSGTMSIPGAYVGYSQAIGGTSHTGFVSNFRIVKGTALYTSNFTPNTTPLTAVANTSLLTCQDATLIDNSTNAFTITSAGQAKPIAVSPFTMTTSNTTVTSLGSAYFDGTGDYLEIPHNPNQWVGSSQNFTLECWINIPTTVSGERIIISKGYQSSPAYGEFVLGIGTSVAMRLIFLATTNGSGWQVEMHDTTALVAGQWYHVAVVRNGSTITMYRDGVAVSSTTNSSALYNHTAPLRIGSHTSSSYWSGHVADVRMNIGSALYTSNFLPPQAPLTPVANTQLLTCQYNGGATNNGFVDQSSFNNIITRTDNVTQGTFSPFSQTGWSNYFDGTGDYLQLSSNAAFNLGAGDFTIEMWVNLQTVTKQGQYFFYCTNYNPNMFLWDNGYIYLRTAETSGEIVTPTASGLTVNTWAHVACVRSGNTYRVFINGSLLVSGSSTGVNNVSTELYFGKNLQGYISNFRLVKGQALYTSNFTPSTTPLSSVANTSLLTCQDNRLIDNSPNNFTITKAGDVSVQAYSPFGGVTSVPTSYSNYFDGTGDYLKLTIPQIGTDSYTVEMWVYADSDITSDSGIFAIADDPSYTSYQMFAARNGGSLYFYNCGLQTSGTLNVNTWNHIALTRNGTTCKVFLNGTQVGTTIDSGLSITRTSLLLGGYYTTSSYLWKGFISNFRIVKGTALYTSNFTPSTTPLTAVSGTSLLTCQSPKIVDNSTNNFTITASGDVKPRPFNPFGTTSTTNVSYSPSVNGGSMYFDGTGDYLTAPQISFGTGDFTIECWSYLLAKVTGVPSIFSNYSTWTTGALGLFAGHDSATTTYYNVSSNGSFPIINAGTIKYKQWQHLALVRSGNTLTLYVDGIAVGNSNVSGVNYTGVGSSIYIGTAGDAITTGYIQGYLSDYKITKGAALYTSNFYPGSAPVTTTTTIGANTYTSSLYLTGTSGGIIDYHGTNNLETVGNTQLASEDPYAGSYYSNYFDGTSDYLTVPGSANAAFNPTNGFTVEGWVYFRSNPSYQFIVSTGQGVGSFESYWFIGTTPGGNWRVSYGDASAVDTGTAITLNKWTHFALSSSSSNVKFFVDGVQISSVTKTQQNMSMNLMLGTYVGGTSSYGLNGSISNLRYVTGQQLYTSNFTPSTTPLSTVSGTSLLTCQSNRFKDSSTNNFDITKAGDVKVKSFNPFQNNSGKSLYFDGTGDTLNIVSTPPTQFGSGDFTLEAWYYCSGTISTSAQHLFFRRTTAAGIGLIFQVDSSKLNLRAADSTNTASWDVDISSTTTLVAGTWYHLAMSRSGSTWRIFVNGTLEASATSSITIAEENANIEIGSSITGYIKDLRVTKGVARYTTTFTPPTTPFLAK